MGYSYAGHKAKRLYVMGNISLYQQLDMNNFCMKLQKSALKVENIDNNTVQYVFYPYKVVYKVTLQYKVPCQTFQEKRTSYEYNYFFKKHVAIYYKKEQIHNFYWLDNNFPKDKPYEAFVAVQERAKQQQIDALYKAHESVK